PTGVKPPRDALNAFALVRSLENLPHNGCSLRDQFIVVTFVTPPYPSWRLPRVGTFQLACQQLAFLCLLLVTNHLRLARTFLIGATQPGHEEEHRIWVFQEALL